MIIQHWKTRGGKYEIVVEQIANTHITHLAEGFSYEARFLTNGIQRGHSLRNTRVAMDKCVTQHVVAARAVDGINYILQELSHV